MIALTVAVALAAADGPQLSVARRRVAVEGGSLALYRYGLAGTASARPPVLLVPDLGFGRELFDFGNLGLARWLALRGYAVYVGELRGQGRSSPGSSLASIVTQELPALVAAIGRDREGPVDLVVQGWAGSLALAATTGEMASRIRRVVALNTPVHAELPSALAERFLEEGGRFSALAERPDEFDQLFALGGRFHARTLGAFRLAGTRDLAPAVAAGLLSWMRSGELALPDGTTWSARLARYDRPTLQVLALADGFSSPELCSPLRDVSRAKITVRTGTRFVDAEDYSHLSLLLGAAAASEIFPDIDAFLRAEDAP